MNNVVILDQLEASTFSFLDQYTKVAVIVDENTKKHCYPLVKGFLPEKHLLIEIKSGEEQKHLETCGIIWQAMTDAQFDRKSVVVNLGGGVIGDMGGFCAATYKRGIDFYQFPTTLLAQVDASVGGKLGIDFMSLKNHIGVFRIPNCVYIFPGFLNSLSKRELRSGFAEVIKHGLIADKGYWDYTAENEYGTHDWKKIIEGSVEIKKRVVASDPEEKGLRKILNFGHTIGHAIESELLLTERKQLHGEAIAMGMVCEAYLSHKLTGMPKEDMQTTIDYLDKVYDLVPVAEKDLEGIHQNIYQDKKNTGDSIRAALLNKIGEANFDTEITWDQVLESIKFYNQNVVKVNA